MEWIPKLVILTWELSTYGRHLKPAQDRTGLARGPVWLEKRTGDLEGEDCFMRKGVNSSIHCCPLVKKE